MVAAITSFRGPQRWLSNFEPCRLQPIDGLRPPTVEHAYQALKFDDPGCRRTILTAKTPGDARTLGQQPGMRTDWGGIKHFMMYSLLCQKFDWQDNPVLANRLLQTAPAALIEENDWGDRYWGTVNGEGQNVLGRLLELRREILRQTYEEPPF